MLHRLLKNLHRAESASDKNGGREEYFSPTVMQQKTSNQFLFNQYNFTSCLG